MLHTHNLLKFKKPTSYLSLSNIKTKTPLFTEEIPSCEPVRWELGNMSQKYAYLFDLLFYFPLDKMYWVKQVSDCARPRHWKRLQKLWPLQTTWPEFRQPSKIEVKAGHSKGNSETSSAFPFPLFHVQRLRVSWCTLQGIEQSLLPKLDPRKTLLLCTFSQNECYLIKEILVIFLHESYSWQLHTGT